MLQEGRGNYRKGSDGPQECDDRVYQIIGLLARPSLLQHYTEYGKSSEDASCNTPCACFGLGVHSLLHSQLLLQYWHAPVRVQL